jgi:hypothetical protein
LPSPTLGMPAGVSTESGHAGAVKRSFITSVAFAAGSAQEAQGLAALRAPQGDFIPPKLTPKKLKSHLHGCLLRNGH